MITRWVVMQEHVDEGYHLMNYGIYSIQIFKNNIYIDDIWDLCELHDRCKAMDRTNKIKYYYKYKLKQKQMDKGGIVSASNC